MDWEIDRVLADDLALDDVIEVYRASGLGERRPVADRERFGAMVRNANLIMVCRVDGRLAGIARSVSDFSYVTYLSDLAVARQHQRRGIGQALIAATREQAPRARIVLLSAPAAAAYYPHIGFQPHRSAWVLDPGRLS